MLSYEFRLLIFLKIYLNSLIFSFLWILLSYSKFFSSSKFFLFIKAFSNFFLITKIRFYF